MDAEGAATVFVVALRHRALLGDAEDLRDADAACGRLQAELDLTRLMIANARPQTFGRGMQGDDAIDYRAERDHEDALDAAAFDAAAEADYQAHLNRESMPYPWPARAGIDRRCFGADEADSPFRH